MNVVGTWGFTAHPLVEYILVAEFDIDSGSTVRHCFPSEIDGYERDFFAEHMLPEGVHNRESDHSYMLLNRGSRQIDEQSWLHPCPVPPPPGGRAEKWLLFGINVVRRQRDESVRRGANVKAICVFSRYHFIDAFQRVLENALDSYFLSPTLAVLEHFYGILNGIDLSVLPRPTHLEQCLMRRAVGVQPQLLGQAVPSHQPQDCSLEVPALALKVSIPLSRSPDEFGEVSVIKLVKTFGEHTMRIFNAVLRRQRVLFVGYGHPASKVAQLVSSAVALVSPVVPNVIRRAFYYCNLTDMSFLDVPGFISATTNPLFAQKEAWWDLLCVLESQGGGTVVESGSGGGGNDSGNIGEGGPGGLAIGGGSGDATGTGTGTGTGTAGGSASPSVETAQAHSDSRFFASLMSGIAANCGELWVRQRFLELTLFILNQAQDQPSLLYSSRLSDKLRKQLEANVHRASMLKRTPEAMVRPVHPWAWSGSSPQCDGHELRMHVRRLQSEGALSPATEVEPMLADLLAALRSEQDVQALLSLLPESAGGLFPIAVGFFSPSPVVKMRAVEIIDAVRRYGSTRPAFDSLNTTLSTAYHRLTARIADGTLGKDAELYLTRHKAPQRVSLAATDAIDPLSLLP